MSSTSSTPATTPEENDFNSFYYWRVPIPDISDDQDEIVQDGIVGFITDFFSKFFLMCLFFMLRLCSPFMNAC